MSATEAGASRTFSFRRDAETDTLSSSMKSEDRTKTTESDLSSVTSMFVCTLSE